jgi:hypothetical protein
MEIQEHIHTFKNILCTYLFLFSTFFIPFLLYYKNTILEGHTFTIYTSRSGTSNPNNDVNAP